MTTFKKVTLVTGYDDKGNENFFFDVDGVWYNDYEAAQSEGYVRGVVFPSVIIARFGDVELSGDQWRDLQCPIRMTQEQLDAVLANQPAAVTAYEAERKETALDYWKNADGSWKPLKSWASYPRRFSQPLSAEEVDDNLVGQ